MNLRDVQEEEASQDEDLDTDAVVDVELVYETVINDLSDIDSCLAAKALEVGGEKGLDGKQSPVLLKRQKPSERITKTKLEKKKLLDHALHLRFL
ncbi:hypothetical protein LXL04_024574 [Taraxacum kok-saghyz]